MRLLTMLLATAAAADTLHLRDGTRYYGRLISQDEHQVVFRVSLDDGRSSMLRTFPAEKVKRVERTARDTPTQDHPDRDAERPESEDFEQMLREAFELIDDGEPAAAVRALQRIVNRASPARLKQLSAQSLAAREQPLDELIARTRLKEAQHGRHGRLFQLKVVTRYESAALGRLLERRQKELLEKRYAGRTIAEWAADRDTYERLRPDAPRMTNDARLAAAVIGARLRWEPRLTKNRAARRELAVFRVELTRFIAHVINMPGYTSLGVVDDPNDPAAREARRLATSRPASRPTTSPSSAGKEEKP